MVLGIYGSGGAGCELLDLAKIQNVWNETVFIDDTVEIGVYKGIKRIPFEVFCTTYGITKAEMIIAQGEPDYKKSLHDKVKNKGYLLARLIHPLSFVSPYAQLGEGIVVQVNAFISCNTVIGDNTHILQGAMVGHDSVIHRNCQISPSVVLGGGVEIGEGTYVGIGALVKEKCKVGTNTIIGMGSVVMEDIPDNVIALGNPAKVIKYKADSKVFENNIEKKDTLTPQIEKYNKAFLDSMGIEYEQLEIIKNQKKMMWTSAIHMNLIVELEEAFGIVINKEDILGFDSYQKGKELLEKHYGIEF